jgi:hypothetical protein
MIEKGIRDAHNRRRKGHENRKRDDKKKQINAPGNKPHPEPRAQQRRWSRRIRRGTHRFLP